MSALQDFLKKAYEDPTLQKELHAKFGDPKTGIPAKELAAFAAGRGYRFSVEELEGELGDELGAVSGGANLYFKWDHEIHQVSLDYTVKRL